MSIDEARESNEGNRGAGAASPVTVEINVKGFEDVASAAEAAALAVDKLADAFERLRRHLGDNEDKAA